MKEKKSEGKMSIKINVLLGFSFHLATMINIGVLIQAGILLLLIKLNLPKSIGLTEKNLSNVMSLMYIRVNSMRFYFTLE